MRVGRVAKSRFETSEMSEVSNRDFGNSEASEMDEITMCFQNFSDFRSVDLRLRTFPKSRIDTSDVSEVSNRDFGTIPTHIPGLRNPDLSLRTVGTLALGTLMPARSASPNGEAFGLFIRAAPVVPCPPFLVALRARARERRA